MTTIGNRIKSLRKDKGLTQKEFAEKINVTQSYLSKVEKDKTEPTEKVLKLISFTFGCSFDWLKGEEYAVMYDDIEILENPSLVSDLSDSYFRGFVQTYKEENNIYIQHSISHILAIIKDINNECRNDEVLKIFLLTELEQYVEKFFSLYKLLSDENQNQFEVGKIMTDYTWNVVDNICQALKRGKKSE